MLLSFITMSNIKLSKIDFSILLIPALWKQLDKLVSSSNLFKWYFAMFLECVPLFLECVTLWLNFVCFQLFVLDSYLWI